MSSQRIVTKWQYFFIFVFSCPLRCKPCVHIFNYATLAFIDYARGSLILVDVHSKPWNIQIINMLSMLHISSFSFVYSCILPRYSFSKVIFSRNSHTYTTKWNYERVHLTSTPSNIFTCLKLPNVVTFTSTILSRAEVVGLDDQLTPCFRSSSKLEHRRACKDDDVVQPQKPQQSNDIIQYCILLKNVFILSPVEQGVMYYYTCLPSMYFTIWPGLTCYGYCYRFGIY